LSFNLMANLVSWNVRGLNWPNKQEDIKLFLQIHKVGLIGLLETKVKLHKTDYIANNIFPRWKWKHNFHLNLKGRIWMAWNPAVYQVDILSMSDQYIHGMALQLHTNKSFYITVVYGQNHIVQRQILWDDIISLAPQSKA